MNQCPAEEVEIGVQMIQRWEPLKSILDDLWLNGLEDTGRECLRRVKE